MFMKGYTSNIPDNCARARLEGVNASYKDLAQVCGSIRKKKADWAVDFLEQAAEMQKAIPYKGHNKRLGHRRELGGRKGRYPEKAVKIVLKVLKSAIANGKTLGLGEEYTVIAASANKKAMYPRVAAKGRWARSFLETSRVEIVLQGSEVPKGVEVTPPKKDAKPEAKKEAPKKEEKKAEPKKEEPKKEENPKAEPKKEEPKEEKKDERPPPKLLKKEAQRESVGKKQEEAQLDAHKMKEGKPHHRGDDAK
jgi:large subunit ribosomal protein L22